MKFSIKAAVERFYSSGTRYSLCICSPHTWRPAFRNTKHIFMHLKGGGDFPILENVCEVNESKCT